jgi:hypothetical protein
VITASLRDKAEVGGCQPSRSAQAFGSASATSEATRPRRGPSSAARPCRCAPAAAARAGERPRRDQRGDRAGQDVAGPGGGQTLVSGSDQQHVAVGLGDHGRRSLQQHHRPGGRGQGAGRVDAVLAGGRPGQHLELAVVGGEHGRRRHVAHDGTGVEGRGRGVGDRGQAVAVEDDRPVRRGQRGANPRCGPGIATQSGPDGDAAEPGGVARQQAVPVVGSSPEHHRLDRGGRVLDAGDGQPHVAGSGTQRGGRAQLRGPGHARRPGDHPHGVTPLVVVGGSGRDPGEHVVVGDQVAAGGADHGGIAHVEADVGHDDLAGVRRSGSEHEARLERSEGDGAHRGSGSARHGAGPARDPRRDVDGQDRSTVDVGEPVVAPEPGSEGGVDHEVGRAEHRGGVSHVVHRHPHPPPGQERGGDPTVLAVVARSGHDHDPASVGPAHQVDRSPGHRAGGPPDEHLHRLGGRGVDRGHLRRGQDGEHPVILPRPATGWGRDRRRRDPRPDGALGTDPAGTVRSGPARRRGPSDRRG